MGQSFKNHFLISMPHLLDPVFKHTILLLCNHDADGAMGVIINKPIPSANVEEILQETGLVNINPHPEVYFGGPVSVSTGMILHDSNYNSENSLHISSQINITSNEQVIEDIKSGNGPQKFRFALGYAGWGAGQLEREIENGDWLMMPADFDFIFNTPDRIKWSSSAQQFGINISDFSGPTGLA
jgi:putative transcriptional regulator